MSAPSSRAEAGLLSHETAGEVHGFVASRSRPTDPRHRPLRLFAGADDGVKVHRSRAFAHIGSRALNRRGRTASTPCSTSPSLHRTLRRRCRRAHQLRARRGRPPGRSRAGGGAAPAAPARRALEDAVASCSARVSCRRWSTATSSTSSRRTGSRGARRDARPRRRGPSLRGHRLRPPRRTGDRPPRRVRLPPRPAHGSRRPTSLGGSGARGCAVGPVRVARGHDAPVPYRAGGRGAPPPPRVGGPVVDVPAVHVSEVPGYSQERSITWAGARDATAVTRGSARRVSREWDSGMRQLG